MKPDPRHHLFENLQKHDVLMVVNAGLDGLPHGRPMTVAKVDTVNAELWFVTSRDADIAREVLTYKDGHSVATGQKGGDYVSVTGKMRLVDDRAMMHDLWRDSWRLWFQGKDDPNMVLLAMPLEAGSYWNVEGTSGLRYLFEAAKAALSGERPNGVSDTEAHAKLQV